MGTPRRQRRDVVDATGTRRRLNALAANNWSLADLAVELGVCRQRVHQWRHADHVAHHVADLVADLYERRKNTIGSSWRAGVAARRAGHPQPDYWAGTDIDDPAATSNLTPRRDDAA